MRVSDASTSLHDVISSSLRLSFKKYGVSCVVVDPSRFLREEIKRWVKTSQRPRVEQKA